MPSSDSRFRSFLVELLRSEALVRDLLLPRRDLDLGGLPAEVARWDVPDRDAVLGPDVVVLFRSRAGRPVLAVAVEVALHVDASRPAAWELVVAEVGRRYRCSALLLLVAPDPHVARWARSALPPGGGPPAPSVLSYADVPISVDAKLARGLPELAVLSALAHPTVEGVIAATVGISELRDEDRALRIFHGLMDALPERLRGELDGGASPCDDQARGRGRGHAAESPSRPVADSAGAAPCGAAEAESC